MTTHPSAPEPSLEGIISPAVERTGLRLEDVIVSGSGDHRTLNVIVDRSEGTEGLDLDTISAVATAVSEALDAAGDPLPQLGRDAYQLEVSSPGVSRPLTEPRHWRRNIGHLVTVAVDGRDPVTARIQDADDTAVVLVPVRPGANKGMPAKEGSPERVDHARLGPGTVQVELNQARHPSGAADAVSDTEA